MELTFRAELWLWSGKGAWHFISLPNDSYFDLKSLSKGSYGFGSIRVRAKIGATSWDTSIFPDSNRQNYILPVKKEVREKEKLEIGEPYFCSVHLLDRG